MRRIFGRSALTPLVIVALLACADHETPDPVETWALTETLRIGTMEEGPASFGSWIKSVDADGQGRVWVADRENQEIRVFSPEGAHLMNVGRKGSGPGEFRDFEGFAFAKDGRLWVKDEANSRLSVFSADGTFEDSRTMSFCYSQGAWNPLMAQSERILDRECVVVEGRGREDQVLGYRTDLTGIDTIAPVAKCGDDALGEASMWVLRTATGGRMRGIPWAPRPLSTIGAAAETWCAPNSAKFEVLRLVPGAADTTRIAEVVADVPVMAAERDSAIAEIQADDKSPYDFTRIPARKPAIDRITVDHDGRLWVRSTNAAGVIEFRIYSPVGDPIAVARLSGMQLSTFGPFTVRGNSIYTTSVDHEEVPIVVRISISK